MKENVREKEKEKEGLLIYYAAMLHSNGRKKEKKKTKCMCFGEVKV